MKFAIILLLFGSSVASAGRQVQCSRSFDNICNFGGIECCDQYCADRYSELEGVRAREGFCCKDRYNSLKCQCATGNPCTVKSAEFYCDQPRRRSWFGRKRSTSLAFETIAREDDGVVRYCGSAFIPAEEPENTTIVVLIYTQPGSANTSDYDDSMVPDQITFNVSNASTEQCFNVTINDDDVPEDDETFKVMFDTPNDSNTSDPQVILTPTRFDVTIIDNDGGSGGKATVACRMLLIIVVVLGWLLAY